MLKAPPHSDFLRKFANKISTVQRDGSFSHQTQDIPLTQYKLAERKQHQPPPPLHQQQQYINSDDDTNDQSWDDNEEFSSGDEAIDVLESALNLLSPAIQRKSQQPTITTIKSWDAFQNPSNSSQLKLEPYTSKHAPQYEHNHTEDTPPAREISEPSKTKSQAVKPRPPTEPRKSRLPRPNRYCKYSPEVMRRKSAPPESPAKREYLSTNESQPAFLYNQGNFVSMPNLSTTTNHSSLAGTSYANIHAKKTKPAEKEFIQKVKHLLTMKQYSERVRINNRLNEMSKSHSKTFSSKNKHPDEIRKEIENEKVRRRIEYGKLVSSPGKIRKYAEEKPEKSKSKQSQQQIVHAPIVRAEISREQEDNYANFASLEQEYLKKKTEVDEIRRMFFASSKKT